MNFEVRRDCRDVLLSTGLPISHVARTCAEDLDAPLRVAQRLPTRMGFYDMTGNVEELLIDSQFTMNPPDYRHYVEAGDCKLIGGADFYDYLHAPGSTILAGRRGNAGGTFRQDWRYSTIDQL